MVGRSHQIWKYGSIIGATVIVPSIYLIVSEGMAELLPFACWVVIGLVVGWDLARMIRGPKRGREKDLDRTIGRGRVRRTQVGLADDWFDRDIEAAHSRMAEVGRGQALHIDAEKGIVCGSSYDDSSGPIYVHES